MSRAGIARRRRGRHVAPQTGEAAAGLAAGDPLTQFRAAVLRGSVPILFVAVVVLGAVAAVDGYRLDASSAAFLGVTLAGLGLATRVPWERAAAAGWWAAWTWSVIVALVLGGLALAPGLAASTRPLLVAVVVMTGLVLSPVRHLAVTILCVALVAASYFVRDGIGVAEVVGPLLIVWVTSLAVAYVARQLERTALSELGHVEDLAQERAAYERLYDLASTLGASGSIDETLPNLLHRLTTYLDSRFGAWLIVDEDDGVLRVVSPVVADGRPVEIDRPLEVDLSAPLFVARALRADRPLATRVSTTKREREGILGTLGLQAAMAGPLVVEGRRVGVLLVGDPTRGDYDERDAAELGVLSSPSGLVLAQLHRQREAEQLADRLREIAEMKSDFVSVVSHELRTPLTSIRGALDTLARPGLIEEHSVVAELVDSARRQSGRLERLINDLLVASRVDRGTLRATVAPVNLLEVIAEVVTELDDERIAVDVDAGLTVDADHDQLVQVVRNLAENGLKYGCGSNVEITAGRERGGISILVADHGPGIAHADRRRVFERFVQLERPDRRSAEGSGLGLSIVAALVDAMGGRIAVDETPGGGATFRVAFRETRRLPLRSELAVPGSPLG